MYEPPETFKFKSSSDGEVSLTSKEMLMKEPHLVKGWFVKLCERAPNKWHDVNECERHSNQSWNLPIPNLSPWPSISLNSGLHTQW